MVIVNFTEDQKKEIYEEYQKCTNPKKLRILEVLKLKVLEKSTEEITGITGCSFMCIQKILARYAREGIGNLIRHNCKSHFRKLTFEEEQELLEPFKARAKKGELIKRQEIQEAFEKRTNEKTAKNTLYPLLHRHDWHKAIPKSRSNHWIPRRLSLI